jgi:peptide chain release factor 2
MIIETIDQLDAILKTAGVPASKKRKILETTRESLLQEFAAKKLFNLEGESDYCMFEITVGNGGQDAQAWCAMLRDMYLGYFNKLSIKFNIIDQDSTADGIRSLLIRVKDNYGKYLSELGVHRLIRQSPFCGGKRQTSFARVKISPVQVLEQIVLAKKDLRIDSFRASGAGGQHVNKSDSAIRIVHLPTNMVVTCQSERSQHQNKKLAMHLLKYRLHELQVKKEQDRKSKHRSNSAAVSFGNHFRTYSFHPQFYIKDNRLGTKSFQRKILKGNLELFIKNSAKKLLLNKIN